MKSYVEGLVAKEGGGEGMVREVDFEEMAKEEGEKEREYRAAEMLSVRCIGYRFLGLHLGLGAEGRPATPLQRIIYSF